MLLTVLSHSYIPNYILLTLYSSWNDAVLIILFFFSSNMFTMLSYFIVNIKHVLSPRDISKEKGVQKRVFFSY